MFLLGTSTLLLCGMMWRSVYSVDTCIFKPNICSGGSAREVHVPIRKSKRVYLKFEKNTSGNERCVVFEIQMAAEKGCMISPRKQPGRI